jgi:HlyD family secretion protein
LIRLRLSAAESEKDHSVAERTLQQVKLEQKRLETDYSRLRAEKLTGIEKLKYRLGALKGDLENSEQDLLTIRAPYDAVVISLAQRSAGTVVQNGQELCQLAPSNSKPRARLVVKESGVPRLAVGQRARFFFDAFPYQRYGVVDGTVDWISPSTVPTADGAPRFIALASIQDTPTKKRKAPLSMRVGMGGSARIVVGRRTMIETFFEPIKRLRESVL